MTTQFKFHSWWLLIAVGLGMLLSLLPLRAGASTAEAADEAAALVASLEGGWAGEDNVTPFGKMGFAMLFEREDDGSLHSRSSLNSETYIDIRFSQDDRGRWILREEAGMEGLGVQAYSLEPAGGEGGVHHWIYRPDPEFLSMEMSVKGEEMLMNVSLRGEDHVQFRLRRLPEASWPELRRQMELAASQSPEEGTSIHSVAPAAASAANPVAENPPPPGPHADRPVPDQFDPADAIDPSDPSEPIDPIGAARKLLGQHPDDAAAHLALASALGTAINQNPADGPRHAFEMLSMLRKAIELDPHLSEAYHWLVGYYLNAPPIAGGSLDKAEETARQLAEFDAEGGESLLAQVAARRGSE